MAQRIPLSEYAKEKGQAYQTIMDKVKRQTLKGVKEDGRWYIIVEEAQRKAQSGTQNDSTDEGEPLKDTSTSIEPYGEIGRWSKALEAQQHLTANLQGEIGKLNDERREATQEITDDKKRAQNTYLKMIVIMSLGFLVMAGGIVFTFVWSERSMIKNVDTHKATFDSQRVEFSAMLEKAEASHAKEIKAIERINEIQGQAMSRLENQLKETLARLENERQTSRLLLANVSELKAIIASGNIYSGNIQ